MRQVRVTRKRPSRRQDAWPEEEPAVPPASRQEDTVPATLDRIDEVLNDI